MWEYIRSILVLCLKRGLGTDTASLSRGMRKGLFIRGICDSLVVLWLCLIGWYSFAGSRNVEKDRNGPKLKAEGALSSEPPI